MKDLIIDPEISKLIPPISDDEYRQLETNLKQDGCLDPLVIWQGEGILLDGHNRYEICQRHGIAFETVALAFADRSDALQWVVDHQLGRRNLTDEQRAYLIGKEYRQKVKPVGKPVDKASSQNPSKNIEESKKGLNVPITGDTAESVAEKHGVTRKTVQRNAEFAEAVDTIAKAEGEDVKVEILAGNTGLNKKQIIERAKELEPFPNGEAEPSLVDDEFQVIPSQAHEAFLALPRLKAAIKTVSQLTSEVDELGKHKIGLFLHAGSILTHLASVKNSLLAAAPSHVCPYCKGKRPKCDACKGHGWVNKSTWRSAPKD